MEKVDSLIVGAGVVGLAIARRLAKAGMETAILEAEGDIGTKTSSRNSEVIHAGIYYPAGSFKAQLCTKGRDLLYRYCADRGVPHKRTGKLVLAADDSDIPRLEALKKKAEANGVGDLRWVERAELAELEPELTASKALHSPSTGIIDSHSYMERLQADALADGAMLALKSRVASLHPTSRGFMIRHIGGDGVDQITMAKQVINAAGLGAVPLAKACMRINKASVPAAKMAKGAYFKLSGPAPFKQLIYPLPAPGGLGIHSTQDMAGTCRFGPNVMWVEAEDYGFPKGLEGDFRTAIARYWPAIKDRTLNPDYVGIRPKIVGPNDPDGDFLIQTADTHGVPGLVNLFGIESPGLTASLAIADHVAALISA